MTINSIYESKEFSDFEHVISSPDHSQYNGKAESAVKTAKQVMTHCQGAKTDTYQGLLDHRNMPSQDMGSGTVYSVEEPKHFYQAPLQSYNQWSAINSQREKSNIDRKHKLNNIIKLHISL